MSTQAFTGQLLELVLVAKDKIHAQHRRANEAYFELYERVGRIVALHLQNPELAKKEIVELCDGEFGLTGDCDALSDIAELIDPEGETFWKQNKPAYLVSDLDDEHTLEGVLEMFEQVENQTISPDERDRLKALVVGESLIFATEEPITITRVS